MAPDLIPLSSDDRFRFSCSPDVPCFNACCRDLNQFLTPHDILMLKQYLGISSGEFLERYTLQHVGPESGLPVVTLKPADTRHNACCFVTPDGCRVYPSRPASCRTYPLARAISRCRETGRITEHFALLKESHCKGHGRGRPQSAAQWVRDQRIYDCNRINDLLVEIIAMKNRLMPGPLDLRRRHLFFLALYDIDAFRDHVFNQRLLDGFDVPPEQLEAARTNDLALLEIGHQWLKQALFRPEPPDS